MFSESLPIFVTLWPSTNAGNHDGNLRIDFQNSLDVYKIKFVTFNGYIYVLTNIEKMQENH